MSADAADRRLVRNTVLTILALTALRLLAAAWTPLTFDEAYYWLWSKHLAGGYYDHPPMVALVIRAGTMIAGDTEFGVRLVSVLSALPMSYAVYRAAAIADGGSVQLDPPAAERWLPVLTDLRLVIAQRLGIVRDEDEVPRDPLGEVYHWLAELQTYLIDAIEALE